MTTTEHARLSEQTRDLLETQGLIGPAELAEYLGVPVATVYKWNHLGTGPRFLRIGKHVRYRPSDVASWLEQHTHREAA